MMDRPTSMGEKTISGGEGGGGGGDTTQKAVSELSSETHSSELSYALVI